MYLANNSISLILHVLNFTIESFISNENEYYICLKGNMIGNFKHDYIYILCIYYLSSKKKIKIIRYKFVTFYYFIEKL